MANAHPARVRCGLSLNPYGVEKLRQVGASQLVPEWALSRLVDAAIANYIAGHWRPDMAPAATENEPTPVVVPTPAIPVEPVELQETEVPQQPADPVVQAEPVKVVEPQPPVAPIENAVQEIVEPVAETPTKPAPVLDQPAEPRPEPRRIGPPPEWLVARTPTPEEVVELKRLVDEVSGWYYGYNFSAKRFARKVAKSPYPSVRQAAEYFLSQGKELSRTDRKTALRRLEAGKPMMTSYMQERFRPIADAA